MQRALVQIYLDALSEITPVAVPPGPDHQANSWLYINGQDVIIFPDTSKKARELAAALIEVAGNLEGLGR